MAFYTFIGLVRYITVKIAFTAKYVPTNANTVIVFGLIFTLPPSSPCALCWQQLYFVWGKKKKPEALDLLDPVFVPLGKLIACFLCPLINHCHLDIPIGLACWDAWFNTHSDTLGDCPLPPPSPPLALCTPAICFNITLSIPNVYRCLRHKSS